jgi:hypothetical protein
MLTQLVQAQALGSNRGKSVRAKNYLRDKAHTWQFIWDVTLKEIRIRITTPMVDQRVIK